MLKKLSTCSPEPFSEKDLFCTFLDVFQDYLPYSTQKTPLISQETVSWFKFHSFAPHDSIFDTELLILLLASSESFSVSILDLDGDFKLIYFTKDRTITHSEILPISSKKSINYSLEPILVTNHVQHLKFISLRTKQEIHVFDSDCPILGFSSNAEYLIVSRTNDILILDRDYNKICSITNFRRINWPTSQPKLLPIALSSRWLAFPDSKPHLNYFSKCGDTLSDDNQSFIVAAKSVNKLLWNSLSSFTNTFVSNFSMKTPSQDISHMCTCSSSKLNTETNTFTPGIATVIDLKKLHKKFTNATPSAELSNSLDVHDFHNTGVIVAHFLAHKSASIGYMKFDTTGTLLFTSCVHGYSFNIFRIANHPFDERQTAVHHLYILERGNTPCEIVNMTFSHDSRWVAVSSNHGTTHVYPITPYGGPVTFRTHSRSRVVNRTSKYLLSSGFTEHQITRPDVPKGQSLNKCYCIAGQETCKECLTGISSNFIEAFTDLGTSEEAALLSATQIATSLLSGSSNTQHNVWNSARIPPFPRPCFIRPEARLRPHAASAASLGGAIDAVGQTASITATEGVNLATSATYAITNKLMVGGSQISQNVGLCPLHAINENFQRPQTAPNNFQNQNLNPPSPWYANRPVSQADSHEMNRVSNHSFIHSITGAQFHIPICWYNSLAGFSRTNSHGSLTNIAALGGRTPSAMNIRGDPYTSGQNSSDSLFLLTMNRYLVEYELTVTHLDQNTQQGDHFFEESPIKVECKPICQWPLGKHLNEILATGTTLFFNDIPPNLLSHQPETLSDEIPGESSSSSLWCSQIEMNTHLSPPTKLISGPQFSFRTYHEGSLFGDTGTEPVLLDSPFMQQNTSNSRQTINSCNDGRIHLETEDNSDCISLKSVSYSLADSSFCGSMSSISRSNDDVLMSIAEAMQDDVDGVDLAGFESNRKKTAVLKEITDDISVCESDFLSLDDSTASLCFPSPNIRSSEPIDISKLGSMTSNFRVNKALREPSKLSLESIELATEMPLKERRGSGLKIQKKNDSNDFTNIHSYEEQRDLEMKYTKDKTKTFFCSADVIAPCVEKKGFDPLIVASASELSLSTNNRLDITANSNSSILVSSDVETSPINSTVLSVNKSNKKSKKKLKKKKSTAESSHDQSLDVTIKPKETGWEDQVNLVEAEN